MKPAPTSPTSVVARSWGNWPWFLILLTAVLITYRSVPTFEYVNYDDDRYIQNNRALDGGLTPRNLAWAFEANLLYGSRDAEYWQPVTSISRLIDRSLFGTGPSGPHAHSVLLHALNACLVFLLLRRLGGDEWFSGLVSLVFALHPMNAEAVCWLAGRKDLLCAMGSLLTLLAYVRFAARPTLGRYALTLGAYALALMAKPAALILPAAMFLLDLWPLRRAGAIGTDAYPSGFPRWLGLAAEKLPFVLLAVLASGLTLVGQRELGGIHESVQSLPMRVATAAMGYVDYLRMFVWPSGLCVLYPAAGNAPAVADVFRALAILISLTTLFLIVRRRAPAALLGWAWFLVLLAPLMGVVSFGRQSVADRYMYLPMLGLAVIFVAVGGLLRSRIPRSSRPWWTLAGSFALLLVLASLTHAQSLTWKDSGSLWRKALETNFNNAVAHSNYGVFLARAGDERGAELQFRLALKGAPNSPAMGEQLAVLLMSQRRFEPVIPLVEKLIQVAPATMSLHRILATAYAQLGQADNALRAQVRGEAIRGRIFLTQGMDFVDRQEWLAAREQFAQAWVSQDAIELLSRQRYSLRPAGEWAPRAQAALTHQSAPLSAAQAAVGGLILGLQGRWRDAGSAFGECVRLDRNDQDAKWRQVVCRFRAGETEVARREYEALLSEHPDNSDMIRSWNAAQTGAGAPAAKP